jgi:hypothetical protein
VATFKNGPKDATPTTSKTALTINKMPIKEKKIISFKDKIL